MSYNSYLGWRMIMSAYSRDLNNICIKKRRDMRKKYNPLVDLTENEFRLQYRISKDCFLHLCQELRELSNLKSSSHVSLEFKVLTALFFFATGSYQRPVGVARNASQKSCSEYIDQVTNALNSINLLNKYIKFPTSVRERLVVAEKFYSKYGIPGVIGCIDGSHFHIFKPKNEVEHTYYCRKHFHSLNVQMICDSDCRIISVNPKFGGSNHDSFIWENSKINQYIQSIHQSGEMVWLLGDSGYPLRPWLMTPYQNPPEQSPQAKFNERHIKTRVLIENTFGRLKNRWRCLCKDRVLHYKPEKSAKIITACCVLYNMALDFAVPIPDDNSDYNEHGEEQVHHIESEATTDLIRGRATRDRLASRIENL